MSDGQLSVERVRILGDSLPHATVLLRLNERSSRPNPFFTPGYIETYLTHNETHRRSEIEPFILVARRSSTREIVAALPLKRLWDRSSGVPFRRIEFLVTSEIDLPTLLAAPDDEMPAARAMLRALSRSLHRASVVELIRQPSHSPLFQMRDVARVPWADVRDSEGMPVSSIRTTKHRDVKGYFQALSHKMRSNVSRLARKLFAQGRLEYLTAYAPAVALDLLEVYLDVEARSWKSGTDASLRRNPVRVEMYRTLLLHPGEVRYHIDLLLLDDLPIAAFLSMQYRQTLFAMETCYDEAYGELGAGNLMLFLAIRRAVELGIDEMSLHGHFDYYKHRWLADTLETRDIRILRRGSVPHVRAAIGTTLRRVRGEGERKAGIPVGQPGRVRDVPTRERTSRSNEIGAKLRSHAMVTRLDDAALRAALPFSTSGETS